MPFFSGGGLGRGISTLQLLVHGPNFIRLFWRLYQDKRVSVLAKAILSVGVLYFIVPTDLIPGFPFVFLGYLDDAVVVYACVRLFIKLCPPNVVQEHVRLIDQGG